jgi:integrase/recombinase XerD
MFLDPCLVRFDAADGNRHRLRLGHLLLDDYLELVAARARPNTLLAAAWDLKVFFGVVAKDPVEVTTADVLAFISDQRRPRRGPGVVRLEDGESSLAARTIKRRLASVGGCSPTW